jgi:NADPH:quinone reductase
MRAFIIPEFGQPGSIGERPRPEPGHGELLVRVAAAGVTPMDPVYGTGMAKAFMEHRLPLTPGTDYAGTVVALGPGVEGFAVGDEVFGDVGKPFVGEGSFAEYVTAAAKNAVPRPASIPAAVATAFPRSATTALEAVEALHATAGETVAVFGAGGGIGSFATELASRRGLHVIAVTRPENFDYVRQLGAEDVIDYTSADVVAELRSRHPAGLAGIVDLFHDAAGLAPYAAAVRPDGWLVSPLARGVQELLAGTAVHVHLTGLPVERTGEVLELFAGQPTKVALDVLPLDQASEALAREATHLVQGKLALGIDSTGGAEGV